MSSNVLDLLSLAVTDLGGAPRPGQQKMAKAVAEAIDKEPVSYTHLTLPTILRSCRSRWSPYH